jgi:diguanylate cyclase (GGDEF)-like protein
MDQPTSPQLAALLKQYVALSENGIAALDADNRFIFHNDSFVRMFDFADQSMLGKTHRDLVCWMYVQQRGTNIEWPTLESWLHYVQSRHRSAPFRSFEVDLKDGRWILMTEQVCPGGELVMFCSDITRQKATEQALRLAHEDIERLALTDDLTGAPNRRNFMQQLGQELSKSQRYKRPSCLAMLDLDFFKKVNDRYGHAAGDEVLKHFAYFVRRHLRVEDVLGRLGGEEFAVLLPDTALDGAALVLNRVNQLLRDERLLQVAPDFGYSFSGGLVQAGAEPGQSGSALLALADKALYQAKAAGRDRICVNVTTVS